MLAGGVLPLLKEVEYHCCWCQRGATAAQGPMPPMLRGWKRWRAAGRHWDGKAPVRQWENIVADDGGVPPALTPMGYQCC